jgi:hypothetical protein
MVRPVARWMANDPLGVVDDERGDLVRVGDAKACDNRAFHSTLLIARK